MSWHHSGGPFVQHRIFDGGKVGHVVRLERRWLAMYDGNVIGRLNDEFSAKQVVEQRGQM